MTEKKHPPSPALLSLLSILDLEVLEVNLFRGCSAQEGWQRVFGGQVLGQALVAAGRTIEAKRTSHSLHGYFLLAGDPSQPIFYEVERVRDGKSFSTRHVKAKQQGNIIFTMSVSFHKKEDDVFEHQDKTPDVLSPDKLANTIEIISKFKNDLPKNLLTYLEKERPIEIKPVDVTRYLNRRPSHAMQYIWMRANGSLPDDPLLHQCMLAYASDYTLLDTALIPHGKLIFDRDIQLASLDHSLWIHRPFRADNWLLYAQDSPSAHGARGFCRGAFYSLEGKLIASVAQEGLIRKRQTEIFN